MADETQTPPTADPNANGSGNAGTPPPAAPPADTTPRFTQAELDQHINARLQRERDAAAAKAAKDKEAAEAERQKAQGEWQQLATSHESRVKELEAFQTQHDSTVDAYDKALSRRIKAETADWPTEAKDALPKDATALELADAVERLRPMVARMTSTTPPGRTPGNSASPRPSGGVPGRTAVDEERAALRSSGKYTP
jgi:hypothetical protein